MFHYNEFFLIILTFKGSINCKSFQTQSCCVRTPVRDSTYGIKRPLGKPRLYDLRKPLHMGMQEGLLGLNPRSKKQPLNRVFYAPSISTVDRIHNLDEFYSIRPRTLLKRGFDWKAHPSPTVTVKHIIAVEKKTLQKQVKMTGLQYIYSYSSRYKCTQVIFMLRCNEFCSRLEWGSTKSILHFGMPFHQQNIFMKSHGFGFIIFDFSLPISGKLGGLIKLTTE